MIEACVILVLCFFDFAFFLLWRIEASSARYWRQHAERLAVELRQRSAVVWSLAARCCKQSELLAARAMRADPQDDAEDQWDDQGHEEED